MATTNKFSDLYAATQPVDTQATELMAGIAAMRKQASATMEKLALPMPAAMRAVLARGRTSAGASKAKLTDFVGRAPAPADSAAADPSWLPSWLTDRLTGRNAAIAGGTGGALGLGGLAMSGGGGGGGSEASPNGSGGYNKYRAAQAVDPSTMGQISRAMRNPLDAMYSSTLGRNDKDQNKVIGRDRSGAAIYGSTQYGQALLDATHKQMDSVTSGVANGMDDQLAADRMKALRAGINPGQGTLPLTAGQRQLQTYSERPGASRKQPGVAPGTAPTGRTRPAIYKSRPQADTETYGTY